MGGDDVRGACPTDRSRAARPGAMANGDPLDHEARHGLAHDGLGPAHGVDGGGGRHHPVGPAQRGHRAHGQEVRLPGPDPDADQTAGEGRVGRGPQPRGRGSRPGRRRGRRG